MFKMFNMFKKANQEEVKPCYRYSVNVPGENGLGCHLDASGIDEACNLFRIGLPDNTYFKFEKVTCECVYVVDWASNDLKYIIERV